MIVDSVKLSLANSEFDTTLRLVQAECHEGIGIIPTMTLLVEAPQDTYRPADFIDIRGVYAILLAGMKSSSNNMDSILYRAYTGYVESVSVEVGDKGYVTQARLLVKNWPRHTLSYQKSYRFFQDQTSVEIAETVFRGTNPSDSFIVDKTGLDANPDGAAGNAQIKRSYAVQYGESDSEFVTRLLHDDRVLFSIGARSDKKNQNTTTYQDVVLWLYSDFSKLPQSNQSLKYTTTVPDNAAQRTGVYGAKVAYNKAPDAVALAAFDPTQFNVDLRASSGISSQVRQWVEVGVNANYKDRDAGQMLAEDLLAARRSARYFLACDSVDVKAGESYRVTNLQKRAVDLVFLTGRQTFWQTDSKTPVWQVRGEFMCVERNSVFLPASSSGIVSVPGNSLEDASTSTLMEPAYRPAPTLPGLLRGVVVAKSGKALSPKYATLGSDDTIDTDEMGRIRVRILWHSEVLAPEDEPAPTDAPWLRLMTPWAGQDSGFFALPRAGQEVVVAFVNGDPSLPVVMGCVYGESKGAQNSSPPWSPVQDPSWVGMGTRAGGAGRQFFRIDGQYSGENKGIEAYSAAKMHLEADGKQQLRAPIVDVETKSKGTKITMSDADYTMYASTVNTRSAQEKQVKGTTTTFFNAEFRAGGAIFETLGVRGYAAGFSMDISGAEAKLVGVAAHTYGLEMKRALVSTRNLVGEIKTIGISTQMQAGCFRASGLEVMMNLLTIII